MVPLKKLPLEHIEQVDAVLPVHAMHLESHTAHTRLLEKVPVGQLVMHDMFAGLSTKGLAHAVQVVAEAHEEQLLCKHTKHFPVMLLNEPVGHVVPHVESNGDSKLGDVHCKQLVVLVQ